MSLCVSMYTNPNEIIVSADSRKSIEINGSKYVVDDECDKLYLAHDKLIFMCGLFELCTSIVTNYNQQCDGSIESLRMIAKSSVESYLKENSENDKRKTFLCNFVIFTYDNLIKKPVVYNIHSEDNFEMISYDYYSYWTHGIKCDEVNSYVKENLSLPLNQLLYNAFTTVSGVEIGGHLNVYKVNENGIYLVGREVITDKCELPRLASSANWGQINGTPQIIDANTVTQISRNEISTATINVNQLYGNVAHLAEEVTIGNASQVPEYYRSLLFCNGANNRAGLTLNNQGILDIFATDNINITTRAQFTVDAPSGINIEGYDSSNYITGANNYITGNTSIGGDLKVIGNVDFTNATVTGSYAKFK